MKTKHLVAAAILSLITVSASAQFHIGAKGGVSASWIPGYLMDGFDKSLPHNSGYGGITFDCYFDGGAMVGADVLFAGMGHSDRNSATSLKYIHNLGYIQVPLYAGAHFFDGALTFSAGPELNMLLFSAIRQERFADPAKPYESERVFDINRDKGFVNPLYLALFVQVNYMFIDCLGVDVKFDFGVTNAFKPSEVEKRIPGLTLRNGGRNMSVQIGLCYKFGFGSGF